MLCRFCLIYDLLNEGSPKGVKVENVRSPLSVIASWQAVAGAGIYIVTFRKVMGSPQVGLCKTAFHEANVSVAGLNASIAVGEHVKPNVTTMLRAYTTYSVTVVAENDIFGVSKSSFPISITTVQIGI